MELKEAIGYWAIQFVELQSIWVSSTRDAAVILRGFPYARARNLDGRLECKQNEVCQIVDVHAAGAGAAQAMAAEEPTQIDIGTEQILCVRSLHKTNALYPAFQFAGDARWLSRSKEEQEDLGPLTCRWRMVSCYKDRKVWRYSAAMVHLAEDEVQDATLRVSDGEIRRGWLGPAAVMRPSAADGHKYTFGDIFSGCGGVTRGAVMAGLAVIQRPMSCFLSCLGFSLVLAMSANIERDTFSRFCLLTIGTSPTRASSATSHARKHTMKMCFTLSTDRVRGAAAASISCICHRRANSLPRVTHMRARTTTRTRPRSLPAWSVCENSALVSSRWSRRLASPIATLTISTRSSTASRLWVIRFNGTCLIASPSWTLFMVPDSLMPGGPHPLCHRRVVHLVEYGLPQTRRRLIMIAACPGETLPSWPAPTHGPRGSGLKPYVTEAAAFRRLRAHTDLHDVRTARRVVEAPRSGDEPYGYTITCAGPTTGHFDGTRKFTLREVACLQGFPTEHVFAGGRSAVLKQIGNAFAPCVVKAFLDHFRTCLEHRDRRAAATPISILPPGSPRPVPPATLVRPSRATSRRTSLAAPPRASSAASSDTMGFSPSPSPGPPSGSVSGSGSSLGKRKYRHVDDRPVQLASLTKRLQRMEVRHAAPSESPEIVDVDKPAMAGKSKRQGSQAPTASGFGQGFSQDGGRACSQDQQPVSFGNKLWKMFVTRASSADWTF